MKTATQLSILVFTLGMSTSSFAAGNTSVTASVNASTAASLSSMTTVSTDSGSVTQEVLSDIKSHVSKAIKANLIELKESTKATLIKSFTPEHKETRQEKDKGQ
ncbi:hypothetical protein CWB99_15325 [Pseudoalteromonas rubra]|uniref:Uncharacterized protein n=1 Tax=Pseudoalteromonas rubra TaxID=43658 RepID=A0A5S3WKJ2_9GAMM|nr:hypothetical protein [Pseudoalteromonas rubra]TMP27367.1 hypothetical protein CWB99_15325 [Pseudoalteromonas rubra]TMP36905.1 hypothetical protein CWC00_01210 [Pseudoalteromonas rubra]